MANGEHPPTHTLENDLEQVRDLIGRNQVENATNLLLDYTKRARSSREARNTAILLTSRWTKASATRRQIGDTADNRADVNAIIRDVLEFVDHLEESPAPATLPMPASDVRHGRSNRFVDDLLRHRLLHRAPVTPDRRSGDLAFASKKVSFAFSRSRGTDFDLSWDQLDLRLGEVAAVVGPNAAGKTTLLRILCGDLAPKSENIEYPPFRRSDWYSIKQHIAYVPQSGPAWRGRLIDNLRFEAAAFGHLGASNDDDVDFIVHRLRLEAFVDGYWDDLSGGYKTRFELARALLREPRLLVLDEPLAHLDPVAQSSFLQDVVDLTRWSERPIATIVSSQHLHEIEAIAHSVIFLNNGRVEFAGDPRRLAGEVATRQFEVACSLSSQDLEKALKPLNPLQITQSPFFFTIVLPHAASSTSVLNQLTSTGAAIYYFRDVTGSTKRLFK